MTLDAKIGLLLGLIFMVIVAILVQSQPKHYVDDPYELYRNKGYNFSFQYPKEWEADPPPPTGDGRTFRDSQNPSVEITGYGSLAHVAYCGCADCPKRFASVLGSIRHRTSTGDSKRATRRPSILARPKEDE